MLKYEYPRPDDTKKPVRTDYVSFTDPYQLAGHRFDELRLSGSARLPDAKKVEGLRKWLQNIQDCIMVGGERKSEPVGEHEVHYNYGMGELVIVAHLRCADDCARLADAIEHEMRSSRTIAGFDNSMQSITQIPELTREEEKQALDLSGSKGLGEFQAERHRAPWDNQTSQGPSKRGPANAPRLSDSLGQPTTPGGLTPEQIKAGNAYAETVEVPPLPDFEPGERLLLRYKQASSNAAVPDGRTWNVRFAEAAAALNILFVPYTKENATPYSVVAPLPTDEPRSLDDYMFPSYMVLATDVAPPFDAHQSKLVQHARRELALADRWNAVTNFETPYDGLISKYVEELITVVASQHHSGGTLDQTLRVFDEVVRFRNLIPLTDDPTEWVDMIAVGGGARNLEVMRYQSLRNTGAFSGDGGKTYWTMDTNKGERPPKTVASYHVEPTGPHPTDLG